MIQTLIITATFLIAAVAAASISDHRAQQSPKKPPIGFITLNKHNCTYGIGATEDELHIVITGDEQKCYALIRLDGYPLSKTRHVSPQ